MSKSKSSGMASSETVAQKSRRIAEGSRAAIGDRAKYDEIGNQFPLWLTRDKTGGHDSFYDAKILKESEKAYLIEYVKPSWADRKETAWVPKSQRMTPEAAMESRIQDVSRHYENKYYNNYLRATAKDNGVKIGNVSSWGKIKIKLVKNGIPFMERDDFVKTKWYMRPDAF